MKKIKYVGITMAGILLLFLSFKLDSYAYLLFRDARVLPLSIILGLLSNFGIVIIVLYLLPLFIFYKGNKKKSKQGIIKPLLASLALSIIISLLLKSMLLRERPFDVFRDFGIINNSFPSMHALVAFASLPILARNLRNARYFTIYALLVAFSRVYFGYHYMSDVVFGIFAGYFTGMFSARFSKK
ncbi:phosphatase PAP2 family protein [Candidatus Woesearchaeota archaeon]|nr:phosphatase PAP2 family protein [Candidatus Woesearchaeota archaeon]MBI2130527.1 phosphatase PAP2 family protein [Candidatus Woesearchaeota archaeon]